MGGHIHMGAIPRPPIDRNIDICTGRAKYGAGRPEQNRVKCDRCNYYHAPLTRAEIAASKVPLGKFIKKPRGVDRTHKALRRHPNFSFPPFPLRGGSRVQLAEFVIESVARFVSPPKVEGESEEFACEDIAAAIRTKLGPEIISMLRKT